MSFEHLFYSHFFSYAKPVSKQHPLVKGWCVYTEAVDF